MSSSKSLQAQAFERLMRPHVDKLYRLAFRLTGVVADAEDLVQDVLVKLYGRRAELSSIEDLSPWLGRVLYNQFVDSRRRSKRSRLSLVEADVEEHERGLTQSPPADPHEQTAQALDISRLHGALKGLSDEHRIVILLHDAEGYTLQEIQRVTNTPLGTLKSRLHRARARLREMLKDDGTL